MSIRLLVQRFMRRVRALILRSKLEHELDDELEFHLQMETEYNVRRGFDPVTARAAAMREFGAVSRVKEDAREARGVQLLEDIIADVRYAARGLRGNPGFSSVAILTIALGIGGTTAVFSLADEVLLRPLPVGAPEQLVFLNSVGEEPGRGGPIPYPVLQRFQRNESFTAVSAYAVDHMPVIIDGNAEQALTQIASGHFFEMLGVRPALGRMLTPDDERLQPAVAVLSFDYWQRRFGGSNAVLGSVILLGERFDGRRVRSQPVTIVGVTDKRYTGLQIGQRIEITMPITLAGEDLIRDNNASWFSVIGRLQPSVRVERAQSEIEATYRGFLSDIGASDNERLRGYHMQLQPAAHGGGRLRTQFAKPIWILLALMAAVLTIACANIANLLLARGAARRQELSVRAALGASRRRIVQQILTETLLLFSAGAAIGTLLASLTGRFLASFFAIGRLPVQLDIDLDARALAFTAAVCLITGILAGLAPAIRASRRDPSPELRQRSTGARSSLPISRWLVVVQVAISIAILVSGSLLVVTLGKLKSMDPGFRTDRVLTMSVQPLASERSPETSDRLWSEIVQRIGELPAVQAAGLAVLTPLSGRDAMRQVRVPGFVARSRADAEARLNHVSNGYFETFEVPMLAGRTFSARDDRNAPKVTIINETAARYYFGDRNPLGAQIGLGADEPENSYEIVGVSADSKHKSLREDAPRMIYIPVAQRLNEYGRLTLALRTSGDPMSLLAATRREIQSIDREILISDVMTIERQIDFALMRERLLSGIATALGVLGLLLAAIGLYGLASYTVVSRTSEIGIRIALGAQPSAIRALMLREAATLVGVGIVLGLPLSLAATRALRSLLYGVSPTDPSVIALCVGVLGLVVGVASYLPARRASRIDPAATFARG